MSSWPCATSRHLTPKGQRGTAAAVPGPGLGLYIVARYLELMGGTVYLASALGTGTRDADPDIHLARDDMAALVGMAPESLICTLSEFRQSGLIELLPSTIRVVQPDKLRQAAW